MNTHDAILAKAKEYITLEKHDFFRAQVDALIASGKIDELSDRFFADLEFGTGGLRGVIGGGFNRMNPFVVRRATQGLADYITKAVGKNKGSAVIAYDSRHFSDLFAREAALSLCANGIKTYVYTGVRSTPQLSFSVRKLSATAGIVVTASHNPPEYNGYKVYWNDGAQIVPPHDCGIIDMVRSVKTIASITEEEALAQGLLVWVDKDLDDAFIAMVTRQAIRPKLVATEASKLSVVCTPLHGTGAMPLERALNALGIRPLFVEEQKRPDGNFPTVKSPNPEEAAALELAIACAREHSSDLVLATDPDADRLGIAVLHHGDYRFLTGNQLGVLLLSYIAEGRIENGTMPAQGAFVKTIVTTELQRVVAESYGLTSFDVLTGFKYIGEKIREFETNGSGLSYIFGGEESYGYLVETEVRDKDAISAATLTAEMTLYYKTKGLTLVDRLAQIYEKFGYYKEMLRSDTFKGEKGLAAMNALMDKLRANPPKTFAGVTVVCVKDYHDGTTLTFETNARVKNISLPSSNVLQFVCVDGCMVTVRPSGTEPKIKFYASCKSRQGLLFAQAEQEVNARIALVSAALAELVGAQIK